MSHAPQLIASCMPGNGLPFPGAASTTGARTGLCCAAGTLASFRAFGHTILINTGRCPATRAPAVRARARMVAVMMMMMMTGRGVMAIIRPWSSQVWAKRQPRPAVTARTGRRVMGSKLWSANQVAVEVTQGLRRQPAANACRAPMGELWGQAAEARLMRVSPRQPQAASGQAGSRWDSQLMGCSELMAAPHRSRCFRTNHRHKKPPRAFGGDEPNGLLFRL